MVQGLTTITGAGAAGSASAYNLRKYANSSGVHLDITVFERNPYVGGRSTTVNVFGNPEYPIEVGGSIFVAVNYNLVNATRTLGLNTTADDDDDNAEDYVGVWNGSEFVVTLDDSLGWWSIAKLFWRYGLAPIRARLLVKKAVGQFLQMYEPPIFPFKSLSDAADTLGLQSATSLPGSVFLESNRVSSGFAREIVQASTRVNYGQNLELIHGLGTMICLSTGNAMSIKGGNWRIFDGLLKAADAHVRLNQTVTSIERNPDGSLALSLTEGRGESSSAFDEVIITGPLQYSSIHLPNDVSLKEEVLPTPFVTLYVTLFASPHKLSPRFFGLADTEPVPETVLTTLPENLDLGPTRDGVGPTGFWSISRLRIIKPSEQEQYVYKIFSPRRPTAEFVGRILGLETTARDTKSTIGNLSEKDVSWFHEKTWHPYPFLYPRSTFDDISLAPRIWYTGGIEAFISTMETSALMGKNVAALIAKTWEA